MHMDIFTGRNSKTEKKNMKNILEVHEKAQIQNENDPKSWQN